MTKRIGRQATFAVAVAIALMACNDTPLESQEEDTLALVGFHQSVDRSLLERSGAAVLQVFETPPAAQVRASESVLSRLESETVVAFVIRDAGDSISAFVTFHDRPTGDDPLSAADSAAVAAAGGRIKYVYDIIHAIAVVLPAGGVEVLRAQAAVKEVTPIEGKVFPM